MGMWTKNDQDAIGICFSSPREMQLLGITNIYYQKYEGIFLQVQCTFPYFPNDYIHSSICIPDLQLNEQLTKAHLPKKGINLCISAQCIFCPDALTSKLSEKVPANQMHSFTHAYPHSSKLAKSFREPTMHTQIPDMHVNT